VLEELKRSGAEIQPGKEAKEAFDVNVYMDLGVKIQGFEICICKAGDLRRENFTQVRKREILPPLTVELVLKKSMVLAKDLKSFIDRTLI